MMTGSDCGDKMEGSTTFSRESDGACPALARVSFTTPRLPDPVYQALLAVPGAKPWEPFGRRTRWTVPLGTEDAAAALLAFHGIPYRAELPDVAARPFSTREEIDAAWAALAPLAGQGGVHHDVLHDFAYRFQKVCAAFAWDRQRAQVWLEPGAGKTLIAIMAACGWQVPVVMLGLSSALGQLAGEWARFTSRPVLEYRPPSRRRKGDPTLAEFAAEHGDRAVVVSGWATLREDVAEIMAAFPKLAVVFDEAHRAKDPKRQRWVVGADGKPEGHAVDSMSAAASTLARHARYVVLTTATPIGNTAADLWGQLTLVSPEGWGTTDKRFRVRYCGAEQGVYGLVDTGASSVYTPELQRRLDLCTVRLPYDMTHGHLPPKRRMLVRVRVEDQVRPTGGIAAQIRKAAKAAAAGDKEAQAKSGMLRLMHAASKKRKAAVEAITGYLSAGKGKIVVFSGVKADCDEIGTRLLKEVVKAGYTEEVNGVPRVRVSHGDTSIDDRDEVRRWYMEHEGPCVLVGTWQAWGTSLNLDDTDVIAFVMLPYTPREISQGEGRGDRLSMTRPLLYLYFVAEADPMDGRVVDLLAEKMRDVDDVTPGGRLSAFGGVRSTLVGTETVDELTEQMLAAMTEGDDLDEGW